MRNTCIQEYNLIFLFSDVDTYCGAEVQSEREFTHMEELLGVWTAAETAPAKILDVI